MSRITSKAAETRRKLRRAKIARKAECAEKYEWWKIRKKYYDQVEALGRPAWMEHPL